MHRRFVKDVERETDAKPNQSISCKRLRSLRRCGDSMSQNRTLSDAANPMGGIADRLSSAGIALGLSETRLLTGEIRFPGAANLLSAVASGLPAAATGLGPKDFAS